MTYFGDESEHIRNMASRVNKASDDPYDYEKETVDENEFNTETVHRIHKHASELDPRVEEEVSLRDSITNYTRNRIFNSGYDMSFEDAKILAISVAGTVALSGVALNIDEITGAVDGASRWIGERLIDYLNPRV